MPRAPSLIQLLSRVKGASWPTRCVLALYVLTRDGNSAPTTAEVKKALQKSRVPKVARTNLSHALRRAGSLVDRAGRDDGKTGWVLTEDGLAKVSDLTGVPLSEEIQEDVSTLLQVIAKVTDPDEHDYLSEAVDCLRVKGYRACVLMSWQAAMHRIQTLILRKRLTTVNAELATLDSKARPIKSLADFGYLKESTQIELAHRVGLFDKGQKQELGKALDLRNRCGHPGKYRPGEKKVSAFLEDLVMIVLS